MALDQVFRDEPGEEAPPPPRPRQKRHPAASAILLVGLLSLLFASIIYLFGLLSFDRASPLALIREVRTATGERRSLAAFELSRLESYDLVGLERREFAALTLKTFEEEAEGDVEVRRHLALALGRLGDPAAVSALALSLKDPDVETRILAIWALGAIGDPDGVDSVLGEMNHEDPGIRKTAAFALGQIGDPRAAPALKVLLQDSSPDVTWNSAVALVRLRDLSGLPILLPLLARDSPASAPLDPGRREDLILNIVRSLKGISDPSARRALERLTREDSSPRVRSEAHLALANRPSAFPLPPPPRR